MRCSVKARRDEYARHYKAGQLARVNDARIVIPADIEVLAVHTPCFSCGVRDGCRHRPWMLAS